jgi:enterochelin esterase-like enzyme
MIFRISLMACLFLLCACTPQAVGISTPAPAFTCTSNGSVQSLSLDDVSRGYPYSYSLYLPPCYDQSLERTYPILYLVPGRGSGPGTWFAAGLAGMADDLILSGQIPPFIIVTTETIDEDMFAVTILEELVPLIERTYRVSPERQHHMAAGGSLGGIAAYRMVFRYPHQFASAGMFGCGAISGEEEQIRVWLAKIPDGAKPRVFLNTGFEDSHMLARAEVMIALLNEADISHQAIFSAGEHTYAYWLSNFPAYLEWAAQVW